MDIKSFWRSDDAKLWDAFRSSYPAALAAASAATAAKKNLVQLDEWWRQVLPPAIKGRQRAHITLAELSHVMKWKLTRGKMRPLQKLVDGNSEDDVQKLSTEAFSIARKDPDKAVLILSDKKLRGVGPATASALLSSVEPDVFPFMSDELLEAMADSIGARVYTHAHYSRCRTEAVAKARKIERSLGSSFIVSDVEAAAFSYTHLHGTPAASFASPSSKKRATSDIESPSFKSKDSGAKKRK